jgi:hypothetical protein
MYVQGPPPNHAELDSFQCEGGWGLPLIDLAVGSGLVVWGFTAGATTSEYMGQQVASSSTDNLVTGLVTGVPFLAGAGWGFREVRRCRAALGELARRSADEAALRAAGLHSGAAPGIRP